MQHDAEGTVSVGPMAIERGTRGEGRVNLGSRPDGTPLGIPVIVINGARPGPTLSLIAGVHGDEYDCVEGLRRFLSDLDPASVSGTIVATPQANPTAFEYFSRHNPVDDLDLNRSFPGKPAGYLTDRLAALLSESFFAGADYVVDLHSGGMVLGLTPFVGFDDSRGPVGEGSFRLAQSTGLEVLYASVPFKNVLRLAAAERGVPSILVEIGSEGRMREPLAEKARETLHRIAAGTGIIDPVASPSIAEHLIVKAAASGEFLQASTGGFLLHHVELGDTVETGALLGRIVDPFGATLTEIRAPHGGMIAELRTIAATRIGDWTYAVLPVVGRVRHGAELAELHELEGAA